MTELLALFEAAAFQIVSFGDGVIGGSGINAAFPTLS